MRRALSLLPLLALAACASGQRASPQDDQQAKQFETPGPDRGAVYIYRSGIMGFLKPIDVAVAGGSSASLPMNSYVRFEGPPGPIEVDCKVGDNQNGANIDIGDGRVRYVEVSMTSGLWSGGCQVAEVAPEVGRAGVLNGHRVVPQ